MVRMQSQILDSVSDCILQSDAFIVSLRNLDRQRQLGYQKGKNSRPDADMLSSEFVKYYAVRV
jgi:hypothetical protein